MDRAAALKWISVTCTRYHSLGGTKKGHRFFSSKVFSYFIENVTEPAQKVDQAVQTRIGRSNWKSWRLIIEKIAVKSHTLFFKDSL